MKIPIYKILAFIGIMIIIVPFILQCIAGFFFLWDLIMLCLFVLLFIPALFHKCNREPKSIKLPKIKVRQREPVEEEPEEDDSNYMR